MARHDATTPTSRRTRLAAAALLATVALLAAVVAAAASPPADASPAHTAAKKKLSKRARCLRWANKAKTKKKRAARRRACLRPVRPPSLRQSFGFSVGGGFQNEDAGSLARDLDAFRQAHAGWIRVDISWASIQYAGPSQYNWFPADRMIQGARARGLNVVGTIVYTPGWARPAGTQSNYAPDPGQYAAFAAAVARRYAPLGVHAYEIWNEPNSGDAWTPRVDPGAYTRLLRAADSAIKGADSRASVLVGGLGPAGDDGWKIAPVHFLQAIYANGGGGYFDGVAHHPYTYPQAYPGETQSWSPWYQMYGTSPSLRSVMVAHGDGAKKIWGTEFGAPTGGSGSVSETAQAKLVSKAISTWRGYRWAGPLFFYQGRDLASGGSDREDFFGLLRHDFSAKPAYRILQSSLG